MRKRWWALVLLAVSNLFSLTASRAEPVETAPGATADADAVTRKSLAAAAKWLWGQQKADGGWHSGTYKVLESGQAMTPLVLEALSRVPEDVFAPAPEQRRRALEFIRKHVSDQGVVGFDDPELPEYPNYATALALKCLLKWGDAADAATIARMRGYLIGQQYCEARGFNPDHVAYGGWGFGGPLPLGGSPGHMDIAHTRHVLEALRLSTPVPSPRTTPLPSREGPGESHPSHPNNAHFQRAELFLKLLQRHPSETRPQPSDSGVARPAGWHAPFDGGFYFSPIVLAANKGREAMHKGQPYFRSYATATCEGVLALLAAGVTRDDQRVQAAAKWLREHPRLDYPEGVPNNQPEPWGESIAFYHYAVRARTDAALKLPGAWRQDMAKLLAARQEPDGSFKNKVSHLMKEDDSLLATALAVSGLCECAAK
jgi:squalene-hopene/tetraprenyl-beta-curcumene cyclase